MYNVEVFNLKRLSVFVRLTSNLRDVWGCRSRFLHTLALHEVQKVHRRFEHFEKELEIRKHIEKHSIYFLLVVFSKDICE